MYNKNLNENYGLKEFRIAATSYNNLLKRRDEFKAILPNYSAQKAGETEKKFLSLLEEYDVSISFGNSVTNDLREKTIDQMMPEADYMMYDRKRVLLANEKGKPDPVGTAAIS